MSDLVANPEDQFSQNETHIYLSSSSRGHLIRFYSVNAPICIFFIESPPLKSPTSKFLLQVSKFMIFMVYSMSHVTRNPGLTQVCAATRSSWRTVISEFETTLLTPSFGNHLFAYHLVLKHTHTNMILSSICIPKVVKNATKKFEKQFINKNLTPKNDLDLVFYMCKGGNPKILN